MSDQGWIVRGPRWWLVVRLVGAIGWALALLFDIAWKLVVGFLPALTALPEASGGWFSRSKRSGWWHWGTGFGWRGGGCGCSVNPSHQRSGERMVLIDRLVEAAGVAGPGSCSAQGCAASRPPGPSVSGS
jgi:hypothetical protein